MLAMFFFVWTLIISDPVYERPAIFICRHGVAAAHI